MDYSKLNYTVQKKTDRVCELKKERAKWSHFCKLVTGVNSLLLAYILLYNNRFTSYATTALENQNLAGGIKALDSIVLILFAVSVLILYWSVGEDREVKETYEKLRKDLIKTINNGFCTCIGTCACKDEYIKAMEVKGVDLIY